MSGELRYQAELEQLTLDLELADSTIRPPLFLGYLMEPQRSLPARRFRLERRGTPLDSLAFTVVIDEELGATFRPRLLPVYIDSLPDTIVREATVRFAATTEGLAENESLDVYFRPREGGATRRVVVAGPTRQGTVTLNNATLADLLPGPYAVYLIRHQQYRGQEASVKAALRTEYVTAARTIIVE